MANPGRPTKYKIGTTIENDLIIARPKKTNKGTKGRTRVYVRCQKCSTTRLGDITVRIKQKDATISPKCNCMKRIHIGAIINNKEIIAIYYDVNDPKKIKVKSKCLHCGEEVITRDRIFYYHYPKTIEPRRCRKCRSENTRHNNRIKHATRNNVIYLMYKEHDFTMESIGKVFKISKQRVEQIISKEKSMPG